MVWLNSHKVSRVSCYLGIKTTLTIAFQLQDYNLLWLIFSDHSLKQLFCNRAALLQEDPFWSHDPLYTTLVGYKCKRFGLVPFRSPLLRESILFLFLRVLRCFTSPGFAFCSYTFRTKSCGITRKRFPHSDIPGSMLVCSSPRLIAAYHVLHRLSAPSHPPYALHSLTYIV